VLGQGESKPLLFAPDCICKDGKYYLYFCMADGSEGVAVSDRPQGPFRNPVQLPCGGIDPAVFIDDDGQAYYYWGQFRSHAVSLHQDMVSFDQKKIIHNFLTEERHYFHEGSSVRKIGDTYYCVFADIERGKPTALGYAVGKSPLGPFTYRGILIDNDGCDPSSWNNHGSLECFHGQWYVFYHRSSRNTKVFRRLCIEPITVNDDGSIDEVKMTSQGSGEPFGPGEVIMGYQACGLKGNLYIDAVEEEGAPQERLSHILEGDEAVFRYVKSDTGFKKILVRAVGSGKITVLFDQKPIGEAVITESRQSGGELRAAAGEYELTLRFGHTEGLEIESLILE
ncbi:MAG: family 43 glycosylhydrolase, partial [Lachnospiraceae bacterium]|nr:family 43 glycosylhydrolase [Lachnospiraceae bacterium]